MGIVVAHWMNDGAVPCLKFILQSAIWLIVNAESCHDSLEEKGVQLFQVLHLSPEKNKKVTW